MVDCKREAKDRLILEEFLAAQRRFVHIIERDRKTGEIRIKPGREHHVEAFRTWRRTMWSACTRWWRSGSSSVE